MFYFKWIPLIEFLKRFFVQLLLLLCTTTTTFAEIPNNKPGTPTTTVPTDDDGNCAFCGIWIVTNSSPKNLAGQKIRIDRESIYIDGCGEYFHFLSRKYKSPNAEVATPENAQARYELLANDDTVFNICPRESARTLVASIDRIQHANQPDILRLNMRHLEQKTKLVSLTAEKSGATTFSPTVNDKSKPDSGQMECPQCGTWTISRASYESYTGQNVRMDETALSIPDCGDFAYEVTSRSVTPRQDGDRFNTYTLQLDLTASKSYLRDLCGGISGKKLMAEIVVSGHFQEGGTLDVRLFGNGESKPLLEAFAWNNDRENPGDSGSGFGSSAALRINNAQTIRVLKGLLDSALSKGQTGKSKASFDLHRFAASTLKFCAEANKNSGGGSWPYVWALNCQSERLVSKIDEFIAWQKCSESNPKLQSACRLPTESFDHSNTDK